VKRKERRVLILFDATYRTETICITEYLNTNYAEYQLVNIVKSLGRTQPNMNSTIKDNSKSCRRIESPQREQWPKTGSHSTHESKINLLAPELFFFNFSTPVYKMRIIQEPNKLELWNKLHLKKKNSIHHV
jgi:glutaredoxin-related protein